MLTATWSTYSGPGRIALSPVPPGVVRGYKLAPRPLRLLRPRTPDAVVEVLSSLDPVAVAVELYRSVYPWNPVIMGDAADPTATYRRVVADWIALATELEIKELRATDHRPQRADFREWCRLRSLLSATNAA